MSWNRPSGENDKKVSAQPKPRVKFWLWGLLGAFVVCGVLALMMSTSNDNEGNETSSEAVKRIKEVTPAPSPKMVEPEKAKELRKWEYPESRTNELNELELRKWIHRHQPAPSYTNDSARTRPKPKYAIFEHRSENTIAALLTAEPGATLVGTPRYGEKFTADFMKSCESPIIVSADDSPEVAELKKAMIDTKIELRNRMANGEDLGEIILETRKELQRLASYKNMLKQEYLKFKKNKNATQEDVDDFVTAANRLLEEKGISPLRLSNIARRNLMMKEVEK